MLVWSRGIDSKEPIPLANVAWARICKRLRSPGIYSKEPILLSNVDWQIRKIEAERIPFIPQFGNIEAKRSLFIPQIRKIKAERTRLIPEIGKIDAKKTNWIEMNNSRIYSKETIPLSNVA